MKIRAVAVLLSCVALAACGGDDESEQEAAAPPPAATEAATAAPAAAAPISKDLTEEPVPVPEGEPPADLVTKDIVKGKGKAAKANDLLSVQYTGVSFSTGAKFDASWDRGAQPFQFPLGAGQVIPGWDQGIVGMKEGGRRELIIPPGLAYGASGSPPTIAPNETLIFVVDLVKIG